MDIDERIKLYVNWAIGIANDDKHGYSQFNRWSPDYDCSSLVIAALRQAGFKLSNATYTGDLKDALLLDGFTVVSDYQYGDILLSHNSRKQHVAIYIGNNKIVHAKSDENGGNGKWAKSGDQTGNEICITNKSVFSPDYILRFKDGKQMSYSNILMPTLRKGDKCFEVGVLQTLINQQMNYFLEVDNIFGNLTEKALYEYQQKVFKNPVEHDMICGSKTWTKLLRGA